MLEGGREEPEDHANSILQHTLAGHDAYHCIAAASSMHQGSVSHSHLTLSSSRATASHSHTSLSAVQFPFGVATVFVVAAAVDLPGIVRITQAVRRAAQVFALRGHVKRL